MSQRGIEGAGSELFRDGGQDGLMHRAFLRATGHSAEDVRRSPVIGIANSASDLNPCNAGLAGLAASVKRGVRAAGGLPLEFPTISVNEPLTRPTSMYLRNLMSMDVEEMIQASPIDGVVLLGGCDKTVPAQLMGAISAGKPAVALVAGPRPVSCHRGNRSFTVDDAWPLCEARRVGEVDDEEWLELEANLNADVGTCNVMGTASSMAAIAEVLGFALPGSAFADAGSAERRAIAEATGRAAVDAVARGIIPREHVTRASLENAFRVVSALGGSTNTLIHLEAIAGRAGVRIGLDAFQTWSRTTPYLGNVRPGGERTLPDLDASGGVPEVLRRLGDRIALDTPTALGTTWGHELASRPPRSGDAIAPGERPRSPSGGLTVLRGSLAPRGAVLKTAGAAAFTAHRGRVVVFDGIDDLNARIDDPALEVDPDSVLVLRGLGPVGAPGMPEVGHIPIPAKLHAAGVTDMVRISDARMSGTSSGVVVLHVAPESAVGGPLARLRDGDEVVVDVANGRLDHLVDPDDFAARAPVLPAARPERGFRRLHVDQVLQADEGCDFDFLLDPATPRTGRAEPTIANTPSNANEEVQA